MCKAVKQEETVNPKLISHGSVCVACGEQVPEGTMICNNCKDKYKKEDKDDKYFTYFDGLDR